MIEQRFVTQRPLKNGIGFSLKIFSVAVLLYFFLVSIGLMGEAFKGLGKDFAENLIRTTANPFVGLFIGILATSIVQSSSTITSIVVGMVGSEVIVNGSTMPLLTVSNAIPIVMGANIGTTVTNTIVSFGHFTRREEFKRAISGATVHDFFNFICVCIMFPLEMATRAVFGKGLLEWLATLMSKLFANIGGIKFTSPIKLATKPTIDAIKSLFVQFFNTSKNTTDVVMLIISLIILFFSLFFLVKVMKALVIRRIENMLDEFISRNAFWGILGGMMFTFIIQSSSVTTSLLVPMIAAGILTVEAAFPIVIGANIGTTGTAILASFATCNRLAIIIAFVHFLFNLTGAVFIYPIKIFREIPIELAHKLGDLAFRKRRYALLYVLGLFFVVPLLLILVSKFFA